MSNRGTNPADLGRDLGRILSTYSQEVTDRVNEAGQQSMRKIVRLSKANAPVGERGAFKRHIAMAEVPAARGAKRYVWHVKAPEYRLAHLLAHGHATVNGGRTRADPFLRNAVNAVLPEYEAAVEEAIRGD